MGGPWCESEEADGLDADDYRMASADRSEEGHPQVRSHSELAAVQVAVRTILSRTMRGVTVTFADRSDWKQYALSGLHSTECRIYIQLALHSHPP